MSQQRCTGYMRCFDCEASNRLYSINCWQCKKSFSKGTGFKRWVPGTRSIFQFGKKMVVIVAAKEEIKEPASDRQALAERIKLAEEQLMLMKRQLQEWID